MKGGSMLRIVLVLAAVVLYGCNSTESGGDPAPAVGTYEYRQTFSDGIAVAQIEFKTGNAIGFKGYAYNLAGENGCLVSEGAADYAIAGNKVSITNNKLRSREDCVDPLTAWEDRPAKTVEIRSVTPAGFEWLVPANEGSPAAWIAYKKI